MKHSLPVRAHSVKHGKEIKWKRNDPDRIRVACIANGCPWEIYAASMRGHGKHTLQIKTLVDVHKCSRQNHVKAAGSNWVAQNYEEEIKTIEKWSAKSMKAVIRKRDSILMEKKHLLYMSNLLFRNYCLKFSSILYLLCCSNKPPSSSAKKKVQEKSKGTEDEQYAILWRYAAEIMRSDNTNTIKIKPYNSDDGKSIFKRLYICWGAMKRGFQAGLRKFICLDGCHIRGRNGGIVLTAVGIDPNNSLYPIAYAVVEKEKTDTWKWFLEYLQSDLEIPSDTHDFTFMSDKQKGLIAAIECLFSNAEHRFCVQHLYTNFKTSHGGLALKELLWKAAKSTRVVDFQNTLNDIKMKSVGAYQWLENKDPEHWSKSHFRTDVKVDVCVNNMSESFNSMILESRSKPVLEMLEEIRLLFMKRVLVSRSKADHWWGDLCPKIRELLELERYKSNGFTCAYNAEHEFEVEFCGGSKDKWVVNVNDRTCSCRRWQLSGIPCRHAITCIQFLGLNVELYVHECYTKATYLKVYGNVMHVLRGQLEWPTSELPSLLPPIPEKMPGRPKKYHRKKSASEIQEIKARLAVEKSMQAGKLGRHGMIMHCSYCGSPGHNFRGCSKRKDGVEGSSQNRPKSKTNVPPVLCSYCQEVGHNFQECAKRIREEELFNGRKRKCNVVMNTHSAISEALNIAKVKGKFKSNKSAHIDVQHTLSSMSDTFVQTTPGVQGASQTQQSSTGVTNVN